MALPALQLGKRVIKNKTLIELARQAVAKNNLSSSGTIDLSQGPTGRIVKGLNRDKFWARIDGFDNDYYSYTEVYSTQESGTIRFHDLDGGRVGTPSNLPAFEVNGNQLVPEGTYVLMFRGLGDHYLFEYCCSLAYGSGESAAAAGSGYYGMLRIRTLCCPFNPLPATLTMTMFSPCMATISLSVQLDLNVFDPNAFYLCMIWTSDDCINACPEETDEGAIVQLRCGCFANELFWLVSYVCLPDGSPGGGGIDRPRFFTCDPVYIEFSLPPPNDTTPYIIITE